MAKALFAVSPIIFVLIGYAAGYHVGFGAAEVRQSEIRLSHDETLKGLGICQWSKAVAARVECGGAP